MTSSAVLSTLRCLDESGVRWVRGGPHPALLTQGLAALSRATDHSDGWLAVGFGGALLQRQRRRRSAWVSATATVALTELSCQAIKRALPRDRPQLDGLPHLAPTPSPRSFPSSHTAVAVAAVEAFDGLLPRRALSVVAAASAFSRLYLGVHFPSDVLCGALLGRALSRARSG